MYRIICIILCVAIPSLIIAQTASIDFKKTVFPANDKMLGQLFKKIENGNKLFKLTKKGKEADALNTMLEMDKNSPGNAGLNYLIGYLYLISQPKQKSLEYFLKGYKLDPVVAGDIKYRLGQACQLNNQFDDAIGYFEGYKKSLSEKELTKNGSDVNKRIQECKYGREALKFPVNIDVKNAGTDLNSKGFEYAPVINNRNSALYFTSRRENTSGGAIDKDDNLYYEDIYVSNFNGNKWSEPGNKLPVNTNKNDAVAGISQDGKRLIIYRGDKNKGDLYESEWQNNSWSDPLKLNKNINTKYHESSAAYSPDGRVLYFSSDRPGGFGGSDLYKSERNEFNEWGPAMNLGPQINTPYNETSVYISLDGKTMFYASQGLNSIGGYDIFKSVQGNGRWSKPENLGYPVNTADDDVFYCPSTDGNHAYFSSQRDVNYGGQDIYLMTYLPDTAKLIFVLKGQNNIPAGASIDISYQDSTTKLLTIDSDSATGIAIAKVYTDNSYVFSVANQDYFPYPGTVKIAKKEKEKEIVVYLQRDTTKVPVENDFLKKEERKEFVFNNIYFDFDKFDLKPESISELDRISNEMTAYPKIKIEIAGHTDTIGSYAYNLSLSFKRAKSAYQYFTTTKKIEKRRLSYKGYSFSQPIAPNKNPDGSDNPDGRQKNRRDEFKLITDGQDTGLISEPKTIPKYYNVAGSFRNLPNAEKLAADLISKGYDGTILEATSEGLYRVCYKSYETREAAISDAADFSKGKCQYPLWILEY